MKLSASRLPLAGLLACIVTASASAQVTRYVDNIPGDAYNPPAKSIVTLTIQAAVDAASDGDTIKVYPGTYTSIATEVVNLRGKAIVLETAIPRVNGTPATIAYIDAELLRRGIVATLNETSATIVRGFEVTRGRASAGAGMYVVNGSPRIENILFYDNDASGGVASGGALRLLNSTSLVTGCLFEANDAGAEGGAIFNANGSITVDSCEFVSNIAVRGGGMFTRDDASTVSNCVFGPTNTHLDGNAFCGLGMYALDSRVAIVGSRFQNLTLYGHGSLFFGAGVQVVGADSEVLISDCEFVNNRHSDSDGRGGAISIGTPANLRGSARIESCVFQNNLASTDGGAIAMQSSDRLVIDGAGGIPTVFENNSANRFGGAISINVDWATAGTFLLDESRFTNNAAGTSGGAIWIRQTNSACSRVLSDSVFITNSAANGGALFLEGSAMRSQLGRTVYCGNDPNDIQGLYLENDTNCFTTSCADDDDNGVPDTCEIPIVDCNANSIADDEELFDNDVNNDLIPDDCQTAFLDFDGLETELVPVDMTGVASGSYLPTTALCWRVYAKMRHPDASLICVYGNSTHPMSVTASGNYYQNSSGGDTIESIGCSPTGLLRYDSYFTIEANCASQIELLTQNLTASWSNFNCCGNFSTSNGAYYALPGAAGTQAGADQRILLMQLTTNQAVKPTASINLLGRFHAPNAESAWPEWEAYGLSIPDPILVDCNNNGIHDSIEIATALAIDADRNGRPDDCQECRGDVDANGTVDLDDLIEIFIAWGDPNPGAADLDGNGTVNGGDLAQVISGWGTCLPPL